MNFNTYVTIFVVLTATSQCLGQNGSIDLTDSNFDSLTRTGHWLIMFYAPWCTHSRRLFPVYEEFAQSVHTRSVITNSPWLIGKVDCTKERESDYSRGGYPTVSAYVNGTFAGEFEGTDSVVSVQKNISIYLIVLN